MQLPYMFPLFLGMTFDLKHSKPGVDIFDKYDVNYPEVNPHKQTNLTYIVATKLEEIQHELKISGDLSLKIKSGLVEISGKGSYLKNDRNYENTVTVLTILSHKAGYRKLKATAKPREGWSKEYNPSVLGTHYVDTVYYGSEMIASAKFVVHDVSNIENVTGEVKAAFGNQGSANKVAAEGKLDKLNEKLKGKANLEISYYGTVPLKSIPNTIEGLRRLITEFPQIVKKPEYENGIPMYVDLAPLENIAPAEDREKFRFVKNRDLDAKLVQFEYNMDELKKARLDLVEYARALPYDLDDKYTKELGFLVRNITDCLLVHYTTLWKLDLTKKPDQLDAAFQAYDYDNSKKIAKYSQLVRKLKIKFDKEVKRDNVASDTYTQWGNSNCTAKGAVSLYDGFMASGTEDGTGGASQYTCAPSAAKSGYDLKSGNIRSELAGIRYTEFGRKSNPFQGPNAKKIPGQGVPCARCYSPEASSIAMFSATKECPITWATMYSGYLMSARRQGGYTTEYICVDDNPSGPYQMDKTKSPENTVALTTLESSGSLPSETYIEGALLRCVVCAMKSNQVQF